MVNEALKKYIWLETPCTARAKHSRHLTSKLGLGGLLLAASIACSASPAPIAQTPSGPEPEPAPEPATKAPSAETNSPPRPPAVVILADVGFATPESVYFDRHRDVYLVSNINGAPTEKDGNGFISRLTPRADGSYKIDLKFIDGEKSDTPLDAPKGLTVVGDTLYVADIDRIRKFSAVTGSFRGEIELPGSTFVNDVTTGKDGYVYVSDSGLTPEFKESGTDAIYRVAPTDKVAKLVSGAELGGPNGLIATEDGVWVTTFRSGELYWVSDSGERSAVRKLPQGSNDGIVMNGKGELMVSSWEGSSVLSGPPEGSFKTSISGVTSPADIGFDCSRDKLLIPLFKEDKVVIQQLDAD